MPHAICGTLGTLIASFLLLACANAAPAREDDEASIRAFDYEDIRIDGDHAFRVSTWRLTVTPKGTAPPKDAGRSFFVFKRGGDGSWRVGRDMDNRTADAPVE